MIRLYRLIAIFCIGLLYCCNRTGKKEVDKESLTPKCDSLFRFVVEQFDTLQYKRNNKYVILNVVFYDMDGVNYLEVVPRPFYSQRFSKGYFEYERKFLIQYGGINDSLANQYISVQDLKTEYPIEGYESEDNDLDWDYPEKTYILYDKDSIVQFRISYEHYDRLYKKLEKKGMVLVPPTPN
jgi:hypothetical protein